MDANSLLREGWRDLQDHFDPTPCVSCGLPPRRVCEQCCTELVPRPRVSVRLSQEVWTAWSYQGVVRAVLIAFKRDGDAELAHLLSNALTSVVRSVLNSTANTGSSAVDAIVIPPSRRDAYSQRGFRPLELVARQSGLRVECPFKVASHVTDQVGLTESERLRNLAHAFVPRVSMIAPRRQSLPRWRGKRVLLLDDIVTSGATLRELERATNALGAEVVGRIALAETPQRTPRKPPVTSS